jgi:hypothetical protein
LCELCGRPAGASMPRTSPVVCGRER